MTVADIRNLRWADFLIFALVDPRALYRQIKNSEKKPAAMSFLVPAVICLTDIVALSLLGKETGFFYFKTSYGWVLSLLYTGLKIIIAVSLMDMTAQFLGYKGSMKDLLCLFNFSFFPQVLLLPAVYIFRVIHFAPVFFYVFFSIAVIIWSALIVIQWLSEMHSAVFVRSVLIVIFPYAVTGAVLFFIVFLALVVAVNFLLTRM